MLGKRICGCMSTEHGDNELELGPDDILVDGLIKKGIKNQGELEVAIGDGMEFTIHGDLTSKSKKTKTLMNNVKVNSTEKKTTFYSHFHLIKFILKHFILFFFFVYFVCISYIVLNHQRTDNRIQKKKNHKKNV